MQNYSRDFKQYLYAALVTSKEPFQSLSSVYLNENGQSEEKTYLT